MALRFNHMELTLPPGALDETTRSEIKRFYGDVFGWNALDVPILGQHGLLLRTDIHRLFDLGYVTVSPDRNFEVSHRLKADFDNGRHYYDLHGTPLRMPRDKEALPSAAALDWHRENCYLW